MLPFPRAHEDVRPAPYDPLPKQVWAGHPFFRVIASPLQADVAICLHTPETTFTDCFVASLLAMTPASLESKSSLPAAGRLTIKKMLWSCVRSWPPKADVT